MMVTGIEILRVVGLFAVVFIHSNVLGLFGTDYTSGFLLDELSRFAVPAFFIVSGFFWKNEFIDFPALSARKLFVRLAPPFVVWVLLYLLLDKSAILYPSQFPAAPLHLLMIPITGGAGFHLWFLPALFMGSVATWASLHWTSFRHTVILAASLFAIGTVLGVLLPIAGVRVPTLVFRNGILEAPAFLLTGYWLKSGRANLSFGAILATTVFGASLHVAEGLIRGGFPLGHDFSVGTIFFAGGMVALFKRINAKDHGWGKDVFGAYLIHLMFLRAAAFWLPFKGVAAAITISIAVAICCILASKGIKKSRYTAWLVGA